MNVGPVPARVVGEGQVKVLDAFLFGDRVVSEHRRPIHGGYAAHSQRSVNNNALRVIRCWEICADTPGSSIREAALAHLGPIPIGFVGKRWPL